MASRGNKAARIADALLPPLRIGGLGTVQDLMRDGFDPSSPNNPISNLIADITAAKGIAKPNRFFVTFNFPSGMGSQAMAGAAPGAPAVHKDGKALYVLDKIGGAKQMHMACEISQVPGRSLTTTTTRTYGPEKQFVSGKVYPPVDMTFRVHNNMMERRFFEAWQETAVSSGTHDSNYYNEYTSNITISQIGPADMAGGLSGILNAGKRVANIVGGADSGVAKSFNAASSAFRKFGGFLGIGGESDQVIATYTLVNSFPSILAPLVLDHGQNDSYHRQSVTFNYRMWQTSLMGKQTQGPLSMMGDVAQQITGGLGKMAGNVGTSLGL